MLIRRTVLGGVRQWVAAILIASGIPQLASATSFRGDSFDIYKDTNNVLYFIAKEHMLLIASSITIPIPYYDSSSFTVDLNSTDYSVSAIPNGISTNGLTLMNDFTVNFGDFNGDSKEDIYLHPVSGSANNVALIINGAAGLAPGKTIGYTRVLDSDIASTSYTIVDVDQDGKEDIILTLENGQTTPLQGDVASGTIKVTSPSLSAFKTGISASVTKGGAARVDVDIATPIGADGLSAPVQLYYDSQVNSGRMGLGWTINTVGSIDRCYSGDTGDGVIRYDNTDSFCLNGNKLIPIKGDNGADKTQYREEIGGDSLVTSYGKVGASPGYWQVIAQNGTVTTYGGTANARLEHSENSDIVVKWGESSRVKRSNASYNVTYLKDSATGEHIVQKIDYNDQNASVKFDWSLRNDPFHGWSEGRKVANTRKLSNIYSYSDGSLFRQYKIRYATDNRTARDLVKKIQECSSATECMDPIELFWPTTSQSRAFSAEHRFNNVYRENIDLNNDGLIDFYYTDRIDNNWGTENDKYQIKLKLNIGNGQYQDQTLTHARASAEPVIVDLNGDGYKEVVVAKNGDFVVWYGHANGVYHQEPEVAREMGFWGTDDGIRFLDLNGDGRAEAVSNLDDGPLHIFEYFGDYQYTEKQVVSSKNTAKITQFSFVDFNADGLIDIVKTLPGSDFSKVYIATNRNFNYREVDIPFPVAFNYSCGGSPNSTTQHPVFEDMNRDGLPDLLVHTGTDLVVHIGKGDGTFATVGRGVAASVPDNFSCTSHQHPYTDYEPIRDENGDIVAYKEVEKTQTTYSITTSELQYVDLDGDGWLDVTSQFITNGVRSGVSIIYLKDFEKINGVYYSGAAWRWGSATSKPVEFVDMNNDGHVDACTSHGSDSSATLYCQFNLKEDPVKLKAMADGHGEAYEFEWSDMYDPSVYTRLDWTLADNQYPLYSRMPLVKSLTTPEGQSWYQYAGASMDRGRGGFLGFRSFAKITDRIAYAGSTDGGDDNTKDVGIITVERLSQTFPYTGKTEETMTRYVPTQDAESVFDNFTFAINNDDVDGKYGKSYLSTKTQQVNYRKNTWSVLALPNNLKYPYVSEYVAKQYEQGTNLIINTVGFKKIMKPAADGAFYARTVATELSSDGQVTKTTYTYLNSGLYGEVIDYQIGTTTSTFSAPNAEGGDITELREYTYDAKGRIKTEVALKGQPAEVTTTYTYSGDSDLFGPDTIAAEARAATIETLYATKVENSGRQSGVVGYQPPRITMQHYGEANDYKYLSADVQVIDSEKEVPEQFYITRYSDFDKYGNAKQVTAISGLTESYSFDALGAQTSYTDSVGNTHTTKVALCTVSQCLPEGHRYVSTTVESENGKQIQGDSFVVMDKRGNIIADYTQLPDGYYSVVRKKYDRHNRLVWEAAPEKVADTFSSGTAEYKTSYQYDVKDRMVLLRRDVLDDVSGGKVSSVKSIHYQSTQGANGYTKEITDSLNRTKTEIYNGRDKLVETLV